MAVILREFDVVEYCIYGIHCSAEPMWQYGTTDVTEENLNSSWPAGFREYLCGTEF